MVLSISNFAASAEQKRIIDESFDARSLVLSLCYSIPGYDKAPLETKNSIYDKMIAEVLNHDRKAD